MAKVKVKSGRVLGRVTAGPKVRPNISRVFVVTGDRGFGE